METYFRIMHTMTSRVVRVLGGLRLVIYASELSPLYAVMVALVGTAIAVTGIADICPMELAVNATARTKGRHRRAA